MCVDVKCVGYSSSSMISLRVNVDNFIKSKTVKPTPIPKKKSTILTFGDRTCPDRGYWTVGKGKSNGLCLPLRTDSLCWWCRTKIRGTTFGCPVDHITVQNNPYLVDLYKKFLVESNITTSEDDELDYFESEGLFGGLRCVKSYIIYEYQSTGNPKYLRSMGLLTLLQQRYFGVDICNYIKPQTSWKFCVENPNYDPHSCDLNPENTIVETPNITRPYMFPQTVVFNETK